MKNKKAIWFSRHELSDFQIIDASNFDGYDIITSVRATELARRSIETDDDLYDCVSNLISECAVHDAVGIFGVFPVPIQNVMKKTAQRMMNRGNILQPIGENGDFECYAAWNVKRSPDGDFPMFEHKEWLHVGWINKLAI